MVEAAVEGIDGVEVSRLELDRPGPSYTADTLAMLAADLPEASLFCVLGADAATDLGTWERADDVPKLATLVVVNRPGTPSPSLPADWPRVDVEIPALEVSSTDLRTRVADGRPLDFLVPVGTIRCIRRLGLYADA
jgi:nicotinate-nucleotide adenylyltransferase